MDVFITLVVIVILSLISQNLRLPFRHLVGLSSNGLIFFKAQKACPQLRCSITVPNAGTEYSTVIVTANISLAILTNRVVDAWGRLHQVSLEQEARQCSEQWMFYCWFADPGSLRHLLLSIGIISSSTSAHQCNGQESRLVCLTTGVES